MLVGEAAICPWPSPAIPSHMPMATPNPIHITETTNYRTPDWNDTGARSLGIGVLPVCMPYATHERQAKVMTMHSPSERNPLFAAVLPEEQLPLTHPLIVCMRDPDVPWPALADRAADIVEAAGDDANLVKLIEYDLRLVLSLEPSRAVAIRMLTYLIECCQSTVLLGQKKYGRYVAYDGIVASICGSPIGTLMIGKHRDTLRPLAYDVQQQAEELDAEAEALVHQLETSAYYIDPVHHGETLLAIECVGYPILPRFDGESFDEGLEEKALDEGWDHRLACIGQAAMSLLAEVGETHTVIGNSAGRHG